MYYLCLIHCSLKIMSAFIWYIFIVKGKSCHPGTHKNLYFTIGDKNKNGIKYWDCVFWGLKWKIPRKFVMERMTFEFSFEEWVGHRCLCPGLEYISINILYSHFPEYIEWIEK